MLIIDDIVFAPINALIWLAQKIDEVAEKELSDEGLVKEKLMHLQLCFEMDEISEEEYNQQEKELLERLDAIRKAKEGR